MPSAVRLREDYSAEELRTHARRSKDVSQSRALPSAQCGFGRVRSSPNPCAMIKDPHQTIEVMVAREHKSERSIRMTLSLAFVAPPIVAAAIEGRLPRGFGSKRLMDLPMVWSHQWTALGLKFPT